MAEARRRGALIPLASSLLAAFALSSCAPQPFDLEAWKATKLAELQNHPQEVETPITIRSIAENDLGTTLEQLVTFLAPELRDQIIGHRTGSNALSNSIFIILDEMPSRIAPGVCRSLSHVLRSPRYPGTGGARLEFKRRTLQVRFFASDAAGDCSYDPERESFWANSDEKAAALLSIARAARARLSADQLRVVCDKAFSDCRSFVQTQFDIERITEAGPCDFEPNCTGFRMPPVASHSPYGVGFKVYGGEQPRRLEAFVLGSPPTE